MPTSRRQNIPPSWSNYNWSTYQLIGVLVEKKSVYCAVPDNVSPRDLWLHIYKSVFQALDIAAICGLVFLLYSLDYLKCRRTFCNIISSELTSRFERFLRCLDISPFYFYCNYFYRNFSNYLSSLLPQPHNFKRTSTFHFSRIGCLRNFISVKIEIQLKSSWRLLFYCPSTLKSSQSHSAIAP